MAIKRDARMDLNDALRSGVVTVQVNENNNIVFACSVMEWEFFMSEPISTEMLIEYFMQHNMTIGAQVKIETHLRNSKKVDSKTQEIHYQNELFIKTIHELSKERN